MIYPLSQNSSQAGVYLLHLIYLNHVIIILKYCNTPTLVGVSGTTLIDGIFSARSAAIGASENASREGFSKLKT